MRARQLEVFRAIMRSGTVTGAAKALNVSQPALSQIVLHTEDELGFRLFERVKGRLVPTPEADELFPEADRLFDDLDNLRRLALDLRHGKVGTVRLAASGPPSLSFVPRALRRFRELHPGVRTLSYVVPADTITSMLDRGQSRAWHRHDRPASARHRNRTPGPHPNRLPRAGHASAGAPTRRVVARSRRRDDHLLSRRILARHAA